MMYFLDYSTINREAAEQNITLYTEPTFVFFTVLFKPTCPITGLEPLGSSNRNIVPNIEFNDLKLMENWIQLNCKVAGGLGAGRPSRTTNEGAT